MHSLTLAPDWTWARQVWMDAIPPLHAPDILDWSEKKLKLPGSARSEQFDSSITPWVREPMGMITRRIEVDGRVIALKKLTFIKPVQSGGSTLGKAAVCYFIEWGQGNIIYYWPTDKKSEQKWDGEILPCLKATVKHKFPDPSDRSLTKREFIAFPGGNLWCRGAHTLTNVTSDNCRYEVNEELHDEEGWIPGRLGQAYGRTTAQWAPVIINITSAADVGSQAHGAWQESTQQHFQIKCPGCSNPHHESNSVHHIMRTRWDDKRPDLGGLRYNADGCRRSDGSYDYNKLESTIRFQMPCGFEVRDDPKERRPMSLAGKYTDPQNTGAHLSNRGYTLQAVAVDYIPFILLIEEKHTAMRALRAGEPKLWMAYLKERECEFWDPENRPFLGKVTLTTSAKKNRTGLIGRAARFFALDWQLGRWSKGETPHWWLVIRDVMPNGDSMLVWEGKCLTDMDAIGVLDEHECVRTCGAADSSFDQRHVFKFCLAHGISAIKCEGREKGISQKEFKHSDGSKRIYSEEVPLFEIAGTSPKYPSESGVDPREPLFWHASSHGMQNRLAWLLGEFHLKEIGGSDVKWETPGDVSEDYRKHMENLQWNEEKKCWEGGLRFDLRWCEGVIAMLAEMAGLVGCPGDTTSAPLASSSPPR